MPWTPYFAAALTCRLGFDATDLIGMQDGKTAASLAREVVDAGRREHTISSIQDAGANGPILDAIQTTLGWDTIYEPEKERVISPVSPGVERVNWGGYVIFDWDTFFAATMAGIGDKDLAYANALETLREETAQGFVPNYARAGEWKSSDRRSRRWARSPCWGCTRNFMSGGFSRMPLSRC